MARADILISLVQSAKKNDMVSFRKSVESLIADERAKKHNVLADRLTVAINTENVKYNGNSIRTNVTSKDLVFEVTPQKQFGDLIINEASLNVCKDLIEEQHRADLLRSHGIEPRNRILLTGSSGNGKTSLAEAIATHLMYPLFIIRYENLIGSYLGETATRLSNIFDYVKTRNCVLFFDEFDSISSARGNSMSDSTEKIVNQLLTELDGVEDLEKEIKDMKSRIENELFDVLTVRERENFDLDTALKRINKVMGEAAWFWE